MLYINAHVVKMLNRDTTCQVFYLVTLILSGFVKILNYVFPSPKDHSVIPIYTEDIPVQNETMLRYSENLSKEGADIIINIKRTEEGTRARSRLYNLWMWNYI